MGKLCHLKVFEIKVVTFAYLFLSLEVNLVLYILYSNVLHVSD